MTTQPELSTGGFEHGPEFVAGEVSGSFGLGPLEVQYEELFAEALADGVITVEERARLEKAADNLGIEPIRLARLEQAMVAAYQSRYRVRIVEHYEAAPESLDPLRVTADGDAARALLLKKIERLEARVRELEEELRRAHSAVNVEVDLRPLEDSASDASEDTDQLWRRLSRNPTAPAAHRALFRSWSARDDREGAFLAAQALVALGAANEEERLVYESLRTRSLIQPKGSVSLSGWHERLFHHELELVTAQIFGLIAPAMLVGRVTSLRREGTLRMPSPENKQDTSRATVTAVRALPWAAAVLGLECPNIYIERERDTGLEHWPGVPPCTVVGKRMLSGLTQEEHAFHAARHLTWYRQELYLKTLYSGVPALEDLFLAALTVGNPGLPIADDMKRRVAPIAAAITPMLEPLQLDALRGCFLRFVEEGGRTNLQRFSSAAEKTAARAGLLLCNDLSTALALLEREEGQNGELAKDLLAFSVSEDYRLLRRELGITLH